MNILHLLTPQQKTQRKKIRRKKNRLTKKFEKLKNSSGEKGKQKGTSFIKHLEFHRYRVKARTKVFVKFRTELFWSN